MIGDNQNSRPEQMVDAGHAPQHAPRESYQLGPIFAALEGRHLSERDAVYDLADAGRLLHPRLQALNAAFSEQGFPTFKERLSLHPTIPCSDGWLSIVITRFDHDRKSPDSR